MLTLGCDPDTHKLAIAVTDGSSLVAFWQAYVHPDLKEEDAVVATARELSKLRMRDLPSAPSIVAIEQMRVYDQSTTNRLKVHGLNGLIRVASTGGAVVAWSAEHFPNSIIVMPTAPEWKGQQSKMANHAQTLRTLVDNKIKTALLDLPDARRGHLMDAVGIALWASSRQQQRRSDKNDLRTAARKRAKKAKG